MSLGVHVQQVYVFPTRYYTLHTCILKHAHGVLNQYLVMYRPKHPLEHHLLLCSRSLQRVRPGIGHISFEIALCFILTTKHCTNIFRLKKSGEAMYRYLWNGTVVSK